MNLIVICLDTLRADIVGANQKLSFIKTPNLDKFAAESVVFDRAYADCQPTLQFRRTIMTGKRTFPWRYNPPRRGCVSGMGGWHMIPDEHETMAEMLVSRGYMTGRVSDVFHEFKPTMNLERGFITYDFVRGQECDPWVPGTPADVEEAIKRHVRQPIDWARHFCLQQYLLNQSHRKTEEDWQCARVFRSATNWLERCSKSAPFFLYVGSFQPHEMWDPPREYADMYYPDYDGLDFILPGAAWEQHDPSAAEIERIKALYYGTVTLVDKWVGFFLDRVRDLGLMDDTIVTVISDHGTQLMDRGRIYKGPHDQYDFNTRINWHIRHPNGPRGEHISALVQSQDFTQTMMNLLGVPFTGDGQDIWPLASGKVDAVRDHVVCAWAGYGQGYEDGQATGRVSVRDDEWLYITDVGHEGGLPHELYHLPDDPEERDNVVSDYPQVVERNRRRIEAVMDQPMPGRFPERKAMQRYPLTVYNRMKYGQQPRGD